MTIRDFDEHTPDSISLAILGYKKELEEKEKNEWERVRWQTWMFINTQVKKTIKKPTDLITFPWEKEKKKRINNPTSEEIKKYDALFDAHAKKIFT